MNKIDRIAARIISKYLRKGNMARAMRDILPRSGLSFEEREEVAKIVHSIVRYILYYDFLLERMNLDKSPKNYIALYHRNIDVDAPKHVKYSLSPELASVTPDEFLRIINREPETTLCINLPRISRKEAIEKLKEEGFEAEPHVPESAVITNSAARYSSLVKGGLAMVQDASSQMVAKIAASLGSDILDYCAGSGGKTLAMHALFPKKIYYAYDINRRKLDSLEKRASVWGMNVRVFFDGVNGQFSVVLVDAPCSGVGAAARNPEAKYQNEFDKFSNLQVTILNEAKKFVQSGGYLVYVVCSYTPQETEEVVMRFLNENEGFKVEKRNFEDKYFKLSRFGAYILAGDVFYMAILRRE